MMITAPTSTTLGLVSASLNEGAIPVELAGSTVLKPFHK